ncbi:Hypothetical predicted protein [Marmota monax]|uniref:Neurotransmitter-gated ion-channel transmembrane domain-containing protein n=1 Tax=Marmota monax TaxID=9995 RepID=A0A5E4B5V0_MARMO|nr:Hypothetical predicted protein [Marmota monax]
MVAIRCRPRLYVTNLLVPSGFLMAIEALSFYLPAKNQNRAPFKMTLLLGYKVSCSVSDTAFITPTHAWLHSLLRHCTSPRRCCPPGAQKEKKGLDLRSTHLPGEPCIPQVSPALPTGVKEPGDLVEKVSGTREVELTGCPESARARQELEAQKQHCGWNSAIYLMDTLLFHLYLLFMASSVVMVIALWNT